MLSQFDELAALYENMADWPFRKYCEIPSVLDIIGDLSELSVFDFGCGNGLYSRILKKQSAKKVVGYDQSIGMLDYARRREEKEQLGIEFISQITSDRLRKFDLVISIYVLPYAADAESLDSMCQSMASLLKPGGRLITLPIHPDFCAREDYYEDYGFRLIPVYENQKTDASTVILDLCKPPYATKLDAYYWTAATLEKSLNRSGFISVNWPKHLVVNEGIQELGQQYWKNYIESPHAAIIDCKLSG